jgi:hypothetical protein
MVIGGLAVKKDYFFWLALVIAFIVLMHTPSLEAEAMHASSASEVTLHYTLLFCSAIAGICLLGICLAAYLKKN